ncbi:hypothetical protein CSC94_05345 [Zhengella mangrovi]|uniref:N-acetyltransferase domain-containing protein n=1 Tax=Zhengella mangrovi TaxID=1982044 RepID=A0A2G1QRC2_9HYPH|nr:GNAT family N-acetyltransferase [Zhengella mangrovi]PHP68087.1 hypothetical protein CSC94_05345 [Zhengella mangrovi]
MSRAFTVRPTEAGDIDALMTLVKASWARTYDPIIGEAERNRISGAKHVRSLFESEYASPDAFGFVASDAEGRIVAQAAGEWRQGGAAFIDRIHVEPDWKGSGVAMALVEAVAALADKRRAPVELTVLRGNDRAIAFYRKAGFEQIEEAPGLGTTPADLMRRPAGLA